MLRFNSKELGLRTDNLLQVLPIYFLVTFLIGTGGIIYVSSLNAVTILTSLWQHFYQGALLAVIFSIFQEIVFRGFLMAALRRLFKNPYVVILINTTFFTLLHTIFPYWGVILPGAFIVGLIYATVYYYFPNLYLISLSHAIVNLVIIPICVFKFWSCGF